jgi:hypothetical protein
MHLKKRCKTGFEPKDGGEGKTLKINAKKVVSVPSSNY